MSEKQEPLPIFRPRNDGRYHMYHYTLTLNGIEYQCDELNHSMWMIYKQAPEGSETKKKLHLYFHDPEELLRKYPLLQPPPPPPPPPPPQQQKLPPGGLRINQIGNRIVIETGSPIALSRKELDSIIDILKQVATGITYEEEIPK